MDYKPKDYKTKDYAKKIASHYTAAITCKFEECPLFTICPHFLSGGQLFGGKKRAKIFFVFDSPSQEDVDHSAPQISAAGMYFREKWLEPFLREVGITSYLITHLVRCPLSDSNGNSRPATQSESAYCWEHFYTELMAHRPDVIVGFGANIFGQLYKKAKNKEKLPDPDAHSVGKLRTASMNIQFEDGYEPKLFIGYAPEFILRSPASSSYFMKDRDKVINYLCPNKKIAATSTQITIDKVDLIDTVSGALDFIDMLTRGLPKNEGLFDLSFDTETENLNRVFNNKFLSWQFTWKPGHAVFIPVDHPEKPLFADMQDKVKLINAFQKLLNSSPEKTNIGWILGHNLKFDLSVLYGLYRILPRGTIPIWDTLLGMHWLDENRKAMGAVLEGKPYSLKTLGKELFGFHYNSDALAARADGDLVSLSFADLVDYGGTDTILTWHLKQEQMRLAEMQKDNALPKLERFMKYYYSPASRAIAIMECNGVRISKDQLEYLQGEESPIWNRLQIIENVDLQESPEVKDFRNQYQKLLKGESDVAYEEDLWGEDDANDTLDLPRFNPGKKDQETAFYLDFLNLEPLAFSKKTKQPTLNKEFLNHYAENEIYLALPSVSPYLDYYRKPIQDGDNDENVIPKNPLQLVLELRELSKLGNTYLESIGNMIANEKGDCIDGRVRASFHLAGTDTGRLCLRFDSRISVVGDFAMLAPPIPPVKHGIPIKDVKIGDLVFCYDDEGNLQIRKVLWQGKTGTKKLLRLHWSAGNGRKTGHLDLTPEHKVRLLDGSYKMAKDLKPDDRLLTMARCVVKTNSNKKNYYSKIYTQKTMLNEHRFIYEKVNGSEAQTVHHADGNSLNNHPSNLVATTTSKHTSEHLKEHWENGVFANRPTKGEDHYLWNHQGKFTFLKELAKVKGHRKSSEGLANKNLIKNSSSFKRRCQLFGIDPRVVRMRYDGQGIYISKGRLQRLLTVGKATNALLELKIDYRTLKALLSYYGQEHFISSHKNRDESTRKHSILRNHIVVKTEELPGFHEVYDLEIEDCHNFIANEICVHNSSSNPNFQNLPSGRSPIAKDVKNLFQAERPSKRFPTGTCLVQLDYKTAEVRWAAIFANDQNLIRLFNEARQSLMDACHPDSQISEDEFQRTQLASDIHRRTASLMYGVDPVSVSKDMRQTSKCLIGTTKLFTNLGIISIEDLVQNKDDDVWLQPIKDVHVTSQHNSVKVKCLNHKWIDHSIKLETDLGLDIQGDEDHRLLVWQGCDLVKKKLKDIEEGDFLVVARSNDLFPSESPKIDHIVQNEYDTDNLECIVQCQVCNVFKGNLIKHIPLHGMTIQEYKLAYPSASIVSPLQIAKRMNSLLGSEYNIFVSKCPDKMSESLAAILGYLVAEGDGQKYTMCGETTKSIEMLQDFLRCLNDCFGITPDIREYPEYTTTGVITLPQKIVRYLLDLGLIKGYCETQRVPEIIFRSTKNEIIAFLRAYFEGEGSVKPNGIVAMSASELLINDIQLLLLNLNIVGKKFSEDRFTPVGKELRTYYGIHLRIRDARLFRKIIGFVSLAKQTKADDIKSSAGQDTITGLDQLLKNLKIKYKVSKGKLHRYAIDGISVKFGERISKLGKVEYTHEKLASRPYVLDALKLWSKKENNSIYDSINWLHTTRSMLIPVTKKILIKDRIKVYDIEVDDPNHIFVTNGFLSENCITFGLMFGMSEKTLAAKNGWTDDEATEKIERFFSAFSQLRCWLDKAPKTAKTLGYMESLLGRRRRLDFLFATKNFRDEAKASRLAKNAPIQGQSSDAGTIGMFQFFQFILDNNLERKWLIQNVVHDSCLVQVPMEDIEKALTVMQHYFVQGMADYIKRYFGFTLPLPIECEIEVGLKYGDLTKWDGRPSTLPTLIEKLKSDAQKLWYTKKDKVEKPSEALNLVKWDGK